jgi:nucleoside-diphosphate-sugar epimerase
MEEFLITGAAKGIGRFLNLRLGGIGLTRENASEVVQRIRAAGGVQTIIHCAYNSAKSVAQPDLYNYYSDNVLLTERMLAVPHRRFVFFSTVDVYPKDGSIKGEDGVLVAGEGSTPYSLTKQIAETLVMRSSPGWLILRPVQMLGSPRRRNVLTRLLDSDPDLLPLTANSVLNCVLYSDVLDFISAALGRGSTGIYNLAASKNVTIEEIAGAFGKTVAWGQHFYDIGNISNQKAAAVVPAFRRTTLENIRLYYSQQADLAGQAKPPV